MNGTRKWVGIAPVVTLCLILGSLTSLGAQTPAAGQDSGATKAPAYTLVEYNAEQACAAEKVPATQVKCLDDFVAKYPNSALLVYVYPLFVNAYNQLKNPQKVIEYADKLVRSEEHTSELQSRLHLVCRLLLEKKKQTKYNRNHFRENMNETKAQFKIHSPSSRGPYERQSSVDDAS